MNQVKYIEHFRIINENKRKIDNLRKQNKTLQESNQNMQEEMARVWEENEDNLKCIKSLKEQLESVINENQRLLKQWFEDNDKTVKLVSEKECYKSNYNDYKSRCEKGIEYFKYQLENLDFYEDTKARMLCAMGITLLQNGSDSQ